VTTTKIVNTYIAQCDLHRCHHN